MSKITRRAYKRKKIIMGASLLGGVGLVSTGFAAWVLSSSTETKPSAQMSVGTVDDKNMEFQNVITYKTGDSTKAEDNTFHFEPLATDTTGRVRYDGSNAQSLSITVEGKLSHAQNLGNMTVQLNVAADSKDSFESAVSTKKYIVAPEAYLESALTVWSKPSGEGSGDVAGTKFTSNMTSEQGEKTLSFTYVVEFAWGTAFGGENPGEYFDGAGKDVPQTGSETVPESSSVRGILTDLHALLDNIQLELVITANPD